MFFLPLQEHNWVHETTSTAAAANHSGIRRPAGASIGYVHYTTKKTYNPS